MLLLVSIERPFMTYISLRWPGIKLKNMVLWSFMYKKLEKITTLKYIMIFKLTLSVTMCKWKVFSKVIFKLWNSKQEKLRLQCQGTATVSCHKQDWYLNFYQCTRVFIIKYLSIFYNYLYKSYSHRFIDIVAVRKGFSLYTKLGSETTFELCETK